MMIKETQQFNDLVLRLIDQIEAARAECQRMSKILNRHPAAKDPAINAPAVRPTGKGRVVDAKNRFQQKRGGITV